MAKAFLNDHLRRGQQSEAEAVARDQYFRALALILAEGLGLAEEMVKAGLSYAYTRGTQQGCCVPE